MNDKFAEIRDHFLAALEREGLDAQLQYAAENCADSPDLRSELDDMLRAHHQPGGFLASRGDATHSVQPLTESAGTQIGPYKLLQQIGEGGMGVVYMAEQTAPVRRRVALKIIKPGMDTRHVIARFDAERQALSLMDHPNIAKVLDAGTTDGGRPYFVLELVKGQPITEYCDERHLTPRQRLELLLPVCQAIQHAHHKGIIHRDIKPTNTLVAEYDHQPVPKVIDFGVAKATSQPLTEKTMFTGIGEIVGTLEYMSPEQAKVNQLDIDTRSNIYSLGVLLYELLTGSTPFDRSRLCTVAFDETLRIIREEEPPKPSTRLSSSNTLATIAATRNVEPAKLTNLVRGELDWIVMKCLDKDRNRRYETAASLAADVKRFLNDEPVQACPPSTWYRFGKFARRNRREVLIAGVAAAVGVAGVAGLAVSRALIARAKEDLRQEVYFQRITVAHREISSDNLAATLRELQQCPEDLHGWEWHYLMRLCKFEPLILRDSTEVYCVAFSPDGKQLASGGDGHVTIWDSRTGEDVHTFRAHTNAVVSVAFHHEGKHLASRGVDGTVRVWDLTATGQAVRTELCDPIRKYGAAYTIAFSPDGRLLVAGTEGVVKVWDWKNRQILHSLPGQGTFAIPVAFSCDGRLATGTLREGLKLWNPKTGTLLRTVEEHQGPLSAVAFSADGKWVASASYGRTVKLSDSTTGELLHTLLHPGNQVESVAIGRDGRRLASGGEDKRVRVWDTTTGREILALRGHIDRCNCVAFSPDGHRLASASFDGTIRIWDATPLRGDEHQELLNFAEHTDEIRSVAFSPDGLRIASAGSDKLVKVWDAQTGRVSAEFSDHVDPSGRRFVVFCVAWHPQGHLIASGSNDFLRVWDARTKQKEFNLPAAQENLAVAFSPDGRYLVTGKGDGAVQVWDGKTGVAVGTLNSHKREIVAVVFSRGGEHLASASRDGIVKLWDATLWDAMRFSEKHEPRHTLPVRLPGPGVAFSPDGRRLATGGQDNTVKIWDVESGQELQPPLRGHNGEVYTLAFSPDDDGRWIASGGEDSAVKIWDSHTGELVRNFRGHMGLVSSLAFSPDGRRLVSGSRDYKVKVWDMTQLDGFPNHPTTTTD